MEVVELLNCKTMVVPSNSAENRMRKNSNPVSRTNAATAMGMLTVYTPCEQEKSDRFNPVISPVGRWVI